MGLVTREMVEQHICPEYVSLFCLEIKEGPERGYRCYSLERKCIETLCDSGDLKIISKTEQGVPFIVALLRDALRASKDGDSYDTLVDKLYVLTCDYFCCDQDTVGSLFTDSLHQNIGFSVRNGRMFYFNEDDICVSAPLGTAIKKGIRVATWLVIKRPYYGDKSNPVPSIRRHADVKISPDKIIWADVPRRLYIYDFFCATKISEGDTYADFVRERLGETGSISSNKMRNYDKLCMPFNEWSRELLLGSVEKPEVHGIKREDGVVSFKYILVRAFLTSYFGKYTVDMAKRNGRYFNSCVVKKLIHHSAFRALGVDVSDIKIGSVVRSGDELIYEFVMRS